MRLAYLVLGCLLGAAFAALYVCVAVFLALAGGTP